MKISELLTGALLILSVAANAATPSAYIDVRLVTSSSDSDLSTYQFRIEAAESDFAGAAPPKAPRWATEVPLSDEDSGSPHSLNSKSAHKSLYLSYTLVTPPSSDEYLCNESEGDSDYLNASGNSNVFDSQSGLSGMEGRFILVPRGHCTFEAKARSAQRLGAKGVIIRNTLDSRYGLKDESIGDAGISNIRWPKPRQDYECEPKAADKFGFRAEVDINRFRFEPGYKHSHNNPLLTGTDVEEGNLCMLDDPKGFQAHCPTQRCLLTGKKIGDDKMEACCAFDTLVRMSSDGDDDGDSIPAHEEEAVTIPALFLSMERGDELYDLVLDTSNNSGGTTLQYISIVPYERWYPDAHFSSFMLWALAVFAVWISCRQSANEFRSSWKTISSAIQEGVLIFQRGGTGPTRDRADTDDTVDLADDIHLEISNDDDLELTEQSGATTSSSDPASSLNSTTNGGEANADFVGSPTNGESNEARRIEATRQQPPPRPVDLQSQSTNADVQRREILSFHSVVFMVAVVAFIFILFFFRLKSAVMILWGLGGAYVLKIVLFSPLLTELLPKLSDRVQGKLSVVVYKNYTIFDMITAIAGLSIALAWIAVGLSHVQPMNNFYYWFIQDVMAVCYAILIISGVNVSSMMVPSVLLFVAFFYDVFYVFIAPLLLGTSSGGSESSAVSHCEKYPDDSECRGALAPLPFVLAFPFLNDYRGGYSSISLVDVILPGLLISFTARYDAARALVKKIARVTIIPNNAVEEADAATSDDSKGLQRHLTTLKSALFKGYFGPLTLAYALGLGTFIVVSTTMSQPALLYLAPICLMAIFFLGLKRRELSELWKGPSSLRKANKLISVASRVPSMREEQTRAASGNLAETTSVA